MWQMLQHFLKLLDMNVNKRISMMLPHDFSIPNRYQHLVLRVPDVGSASTSTWYCQYQCMVSLIPSLGIVFIMRWYPCYQSPFITLLKNFPYFFVKKFV